jgi:Rieske 2Fe-2S family protein
MYFQDRPPLPAGVTMLPAGCYNDPEHFRRELEAIHFDMWLCAGRREQVSSPGSYFVRRIGDANILVLGGEDGRVSAFHNVCRHRGTLLCDDDEGKLGARIQCPYHAWTYSLDGRLVSAPHMDGVQGFRLENYPLARIATAEWDGHVFINLSGSPSPLEAQLADLPGRFRPWRMEDLRRTDRRSYSVQANWKLILQNYSECLHCPTAHPQLQKYSHYLSGANEAPRPTYVGGRMDLRDGIQTLATGGTTDRSPLPGLPAEECRRVYYYAVLPNLLLSLHPDYMLTATLWPVAADRTDIFCEWHFHPEEIQRPGFSPQGAVEFWDLTNHQDWDLVELAQKGVASRGYQPGPYSNREELLHAIDRFALERVQGRSRPPGDRVS